MTKICRVCLESSNLMYPLFGEVLYVDVDIASMLSSCSLIEVKLENDLPDSVCVMCFKTIRIAYNFLEKFKRNQLILQKRKQDEEKVCSANDNVEYIEIHVEDDENEENEKSEVETEENTGSSLVNEHIISPVNMFDDTSQQSYGKEIPQDKGEQASALIKQEHNYDFADVEFVSNQLEMHGESAEELSNSDVLASNNVTQDKDVSSSVEGNSSPATPNRRHHCPLCDCSYVKFQPFFRHVTYHRETIFPCMPCKNVFYSAQQYLDHYKVIHLHQCRKCGKSFRTRSSYQLHGRQTDCEVITKFQCQYENCGKAFSFKHSLRRHEREHMDEHRYTCSECNLAFKGYDKYRYHTRRVHGGGDGRRHLCTMCGRTFVQVTHLKDHMWLHTGVKRYSCKNCDKAYTSSGQLKRHVLKKCSSIVG